MNWHACKYPVQPRASGGTISVPAHPFTAIVGAKRTVHLQPPPFAPLLIEFRARRPPFGENPRFLPMISEAFIRKRPLLKGGILGK